MTPPSVAPPVAGWEVWQQCRVTQALRAGLYIRRRIEISIGRLYTAHVPVAGWVKWPVTVYPRHLPGGGTVFRTCEVSARSVIPRHSVTAHLKNLTICADVRTQTLPGQVHAWQNEPLWISDSICSHPYLGETRSDTSSLTLVERWRTSWSPLRLLMPHWQVLPGSSTRRISMC